MDKAGVVLVALNKNTLNNALGLLNYNNAVPFAVLVDDGNEKFYSDLLPLVTSKGVSITSAVIPDRANTGNSTHMTWEQILDASKSGAEIVSHTFNHLTGDLVQNMSE